VPTSWHRCQVGAKNLAQVPFSLARDTGFLKPGPGLDRPRRRSVTTVDLRRQLATPSGSANQHSLVPQHRHEIEKPTRDRHEIEKSTPNLSSYSGG